MGAYLKMKAECERIVRESGLRWTIFRPSALVTPEGEPEGTAHGARHAPPGAEMVSFGVLRAVPGMAGVADDLRPMPIDVLCTATLSVLAEPRDGARPRRARSVDASALRKTESMSLFQARPPRTARRSRLRNKLPSRLGPKRSCGWMRRR